MFYLVLKELYIQHKNSSCC